MRHDHGKSGHHARAKASWVTKDHGVALANISARHHEACREVHPRAHLDAIAQVGQILDGHVSQHLRVTIDPSIPNMTSRRTLRFAVLARLEDLLIPGAPRPPAFWRSTTLWPANIMRWLRLHPFRLRSAGSASI